MATAPKILRVDILSKDDFGCISAERSGLPTDVQAPRVKVTCSGNSESHVVVLAAGHSWVLSDDSIFRRLFPRHCISCTRLESDGFIAMSCSSNDQDMMLGAACAAATLKRSWAWDETPTIKVRFVSSNVVFKVNPVAQDGVWTVSHTSD